MKWEDKSMKGIGDVVGPQEQGPREGIFHGLQGVPFNRDFNHKDIAIAWGFSVFSFVVFLATILSN